MRRVLPIVFALAALGTATAHADERGKPLSMPARRGAPSPELMQTYYFVLLYHNDNAPKIPEDSVNAIFAGHMANIVRLHAEKKMPLAGPFLDQTPLAGIFILNAASMEEAQQLVNTDPAIQAGRLRAEIHPWYGARGIRTAYDDKYMLKPNADAR